MKKKKQAKRTSNQKQSLQQKEPTAETQTGFLRLWLFRFMVIVVIPVIALVGLEAGLRAFDYGVPTGFTFTQKVAGERRILSNPYFMWRFFPPQIGKQCIPFTLPLKKAEGTYRLFVLGASAAQGDPEAAYGMTRMLEIMLRDQYPGVDFQVINAGITAINSHVVLPIARDCSRLESDLFIIYLGNNEVVGPYGAGTVFTPLVSNLSMIRLGIALKATRLAQLVSSTLDKLPGRDQAQRGKWRGMAMFLDHQVRAADPGMETVYRHFEQNLVDLSRMAQREGIPVVISTVGANLKDSAPFASMHRSGLSEEDVEKWETLVQEGKVLREQGKYAQAVERFLQAASIDPDYAELHYRLGKCYWAMWDFDTARAHYRKALELDTLRFRADKRINDIIRRVAGGRSGQGIHLADSLRVLEENSPEKTPGQELFYEHVHLNFRGTYLVSRAVFGQVQQALPAWVVQRASGNAILKEQECKRRLAYTGLDRLIIAKGLLEQLQQAPFTNQLYVSEQTDKLAAEVKQLEHRYTRGRDLQEALAQYKWAIENYGPHYHLYNNYARIQYDYLNDAQEAEKYWLKALAQSPQASPVLEKLGPVLSAQRKHAEAEQYYRKALVYNPRSTALLSNFANVLVGNKKFDQAIRYYRKAIEIDPENAKAHSTLGVVLALRSEDQGSRRKALFHLKKAVEVNPHLAGARRNLLAFYTNEAQRLASENENQAAIAYLHEILRIDPSDEGARKHIQRLSASGN